MLSRPPNPMLLPTLKNPFSEGREIRRVEGNYQKPLVEQPRSIDHEQVKTTPSNTLEAHIPQTITANSVPVSQPPPQEPTKKKRGRPVKIQYQKDSVIQGVSEKNSTYSVRSAPEWQREADWKGRDLCLCFPVYKSTNAATTWTLLALALDLGADRFRAEMEFGDAMIYKSRNKLADDFLKTGATWSLWIDDDIIAPIGRAGWFKKTCGLPDSYPDRLAGMHVAHRLMEHGKQGMKVVGGLYFGRNTKGRPMFYEGQVHNEAYEASMSHREEVRQTQWVGTGCLLIHRDVFLDIQKTFPNLAPTQTKTFWDFFKPGEIEGEGEDVAFCRRAQQSGHKVFVDLGLKCMHLGLCAWAAHNVKNYLGGI